MKLLISLGDAEKIARELAWDKILSPSKIREALLEKCWLPPDHEESAKKLCDMIGEINPTHIACQISHDALTQWCEQMQTEMQMALIQLPCWAGKEEK